MTDAPSGLAHALLNGTSGPIERCEVRRCSTSKLIAPRTRLRRVPRQHSIADCLICAAGYGMAGAGPNRRLGRHVRALSRHTTPARSVLFRKR